MDVLIYLSIIIVWQEYCVSGTFWRDCMAATTPNAQENSPNGMLNFMWIAIGLFDQSFISHTLNEMAFYCQTYSRT